MPEIMYCKHCGAEIPGEVDICPKCFPEQKRKEAVPAVLLLVLVCSSLLMVGSSYVNVKTIEPARKPVAPLPVDMRSAVYNAAINFVSLQFAGQKKFYPVDQTPVQRLADNHFILILTAEERGPNGEPLRNLYNVNLEYVGSEWKLIELK